MKMGFAVAAEDSRVLGLPQAAMANSTLYHAEPVHCGTESAGSIAAAAATDPSSSKGSNSIDRSHIE
jgi:hypothetical protein